MVIDMHRASAVHVVLSGKEDAAMEDKKVYNIVAINPGSTSTKVGFYHNDQKVFIENIYHRPKEMERFDSIQEQLPYRRLLVENRCECNGVDLNSVDAFVGRGGGMLSCTSGVYCVNDRLLYDCETAAAGVHHPAMLAPQIARELANKYHAKAFTVNPPDTDEFQDLARITGVKGVYRDSHVHCLNQKEVARRYCREKGIKYDEHNFIICHLGGGVSITAHRKGRMIDSNDNLIGDGPMTPQRSGTIPAKKVLDMVFTGDYTHEELETFFVRKSGLMSHLGTDNAAEICRRIKEDKDKYAKLVFDAMIYQFAKAVGEMACVLKGDVDAILITGGLAKCDYVVETLTDYVSWIADDIWVKPGEWEVAALAAGAYHALTGQAEILSYNGVPVFKGFHSAKYHL
jgi:butyrate kinase